MSGMDHYLPRRGPSDGTEPACFAFCLQSRRVSGGVIGGEAEEDEGKVCARERDTQKDWEREREREMGG